MNRITKKNKYAIVDKENKILETFRNGTTMKQMFPYYEKKYFPMKIKQIKLD